jgi:hypothetical protein
MISVNILEDSDIIERDDWVRQLSLVYTGQSDYLATNATYGGGAMNRLGWTPAWVVCPFWVGKQVGAFRKKMLGRDRHAVEMSDYEFVRGAVPKLHQEQLTAEEIQISRMVWSNYE